MKDYLRELVRASPTPLQARNRVREYLQARILASLQRSGAMVPLAFHGGTALRFLYLIPRYSEDLDFALERPDGYDFRYFLKAILGDLNVEGYSIELRVNDQRVVHSAFIRFSGLLYELGLSPHTAEVLAVKVEVDTRPPAGATLLTSIVRRYVTLQLQHHDKASLLAGKLHAILNRPYVKGRDIYDLLWYLSDRTWPEPNLVLLNHALEQTQWAGKVLTPHSWRQAVRTRIETLDWAAVTSDVRPFVEKTDDIELLSRDNLTKVLGQQ